MFVVKVVSDLQQVIDVCGKDCQPQTSITCCKSLTIFITNINDLLQFTDNLYHKHQ
jgi:hypothetical protein